MRVGTKEVAKAYLGIKPAATIYLGNTLIYGGFSPELLSGLMYWYHSIDVVQSAGFVSQINDKSGNSRHLLQATGANQPQTGAGIAAPNGKSGVYFGGSRYVLNEGVNFAAGDVTSFFSGALNAAAVSSARAFTWARVGLTDSGANGTLIHYRTGTSAVISVYGGTGVASAPLTYDQWFVHSAQRQAGIVKSSINGAAALQNDVSITAPLGPLTRICMGASLATSGSAGASSWLGPIGEMFGYNRQLSVAEYQMCQGYLAWGWGMQTLLPSGHPWKSAAPPAP